ncbi:5986_t:CDS:2, partial [Racocetra persica]
TGKVCNQSCHRPEGCKYQKRKNYRRKKQAELLKKYNHENEYVKLDEIP